MSLIILGLQYLDDHGCPAYVGHERESHASSPEWDNIVRTGERIGWHAIPEVGVMLTEGMGAGDGPRVQEEVAMVQAEGERV
jgi:hypothetical protein